MMQEAWEYIKEENFQMNPPPPKKKKIKKKRLEQQEEGERERENNVCPCIKTSPSGELIMNHQYTCF